MSEINLNAEVRTEFGKGAARRTRRAGNVPAVLYSQGVETRHLTFSALEFQRAIKGDMNAVLTLHFDGDEQLALPREIIKHPTKDYLIHIDLLAIKRGEKVVVEVPIHVEGEAAPGTLIIHDLTTLAIEVDVLAIPDNLVVSIEGAEIGTLITAGDIELPEGATLAEAEDNLIVAVQAAPTEEDLDEDTADDEAVAEPEVVGEEAESSDE